jgi:hypothetical protein
MNAEECGRMLAAQRNAVSVPAPDNTPLRRTASEIVEMVAAYSHDGNEFLATGDFVNALAAFWYAFGWLHFGTAFGFVCTAEPACPFSGQTGAIPFQLHEQLVKKASRYSHMLDTARAAVVPAPEEDTAPHAAACRIPAIASVYAALGGQFLSRGKAEDALACFSYGHGWIDAGVRAGMLRVLSDRGLFTI